MIIVLDSGTADPVTEVNGGMYYNSTVGAFRCGEGGIWVSCVALNDASTSSQTVTTTTPAYLTGSGILIPSSGLHAGSQFIWQVAMTKTALGTAQPTIKVMYGTHESTSDTAELTLTGATETATVDTGFFEVIVTVRSVNSSTGVIQGSLSITHYAASASTPFQAEGFANVGSFAATGTSGSFNDTVAATYIGLELTPGASNTFTVTQVQTQTADL